MDDNTNSAALSTEVGSVWRHPLGAYTIVDDVGLVVVYKGIAMMIVRSML